MCGIIGITGNSKAVDIVVEGLRKLEYRGYDSAGVATVHSVVINRARAEGKIINLENALKQNPLFGNIAIGHTRWATHGAPSEKNAHPHATAKVAVVHNGIIENYLSLRKKLVTAGYQFHSETDTEVIPVLITSYLDAGLSNKDAVLKAVNDFEGAYAIGVIFTDDENTIYAARHGAPLVVGYGEGENYIASDALALASLTSKICYLEEGDVAEVTPDNIIISDKQGRAVKRKITNSNLSSINIGKENYDHFMQKEIFEQPAVIGDNLHAYYNAVTGDISMPQIPFNLAEVGKITIVACGTSYYAGKVAQYWIEKIAKTSCVVDVASEFRYRSAVMEKGSIAVFISQSGETADTLAALKYAKANGQKIISIVNVVQSSIARESDVVLPIFSGPEIGVASTKAFTTQLMTLAFLVLKIAESKGAGYRLQVTEIDSNQDLQTVSPSTSCGVNLEPGTWNLPAESLKLMTRALVEIPALISKVLESDAEIKKLAKKISGARDIMYIGRGVSYPIAMEGALKLKEISYIHSEATAAGELKHGPIALIDSKVPVICIAPSDELFEKTASNIREVAARGGKIILISDSKGISQLEDVIYQSIEMPSINMQHKNLNLVQDILNPILYSIPIQLLAYHVACAKGTDVDQPRNLAKSVTVE
jgi:glucosamine--fructose-6-phosphate aminotransferase (isomerizing)